MKVRVAGMRGGSGQERSAAWSWWDAVRGRRAGFHGQGESRPDWAATETLSAAWLPPKASASFSPSASRSCVSSLCSATTLSFNFNSLPFVRSLLHPPVPPAFSLFSLHSSISLTSLVPPPPSSGPLQTLSSGLRGGSGRLRWRDGKIEGGQKAWDAAVRREWLALKRSRTAS